MKRAQAERLECPSEFQEELTRIFGVNRFGDPLFKIGWGQTETFDYATVNGYAQDLLGHNQPCWMIMRWKPPELFGTPKIYYALNADPLTGLALMGEYPEFGIYEPVLMLMAKHFDPETHEVVISTLPLDWDLIEKVIPVCEQVAKLTEAEIRAAYDAIEAAENAEIVSQIEARMLDALPTFYGPTSHASRRSKRSLIEVKAEKIEKAWIKAGLHKRKRPARGFFQEPTQN